MFLTISSTAVFLFVKFNLTDIEFTALPAVALTLSLSWMTASCET